MQFKAIVSLGLFALHVSARPYCKVELKGKNNFQWSRLQPAVYVLPGRHGRVHTASYTVNFETSPDCKVIESQTLTGTIDYEEWKLDISMVDA
ncbi:uncharacterized protein PpBr36_05832 [Pyricularia pennisetigena]|uniref:uncharacterized protein n=1 Tax=Pyricularia pennisetigena TaxID=1578925 RepID=UPI0011541F29|nr:uncharacterized protein PpBr36_05832 [Pyricularia pennisetigena]TLS23732.1 hypothetical protein PpBr36_05832 [Pyricularia pennisetigena]